MKEKNIPSQKDLERIRTLRLIDDDFMTKVFNDDPELTQFVLRIVMGISDLTVSVVKTQYEIHNLYGRSVRLDIFAFDSNGKVFDIEIQRVDHGAGPKRARYNSSIIDSNSLGRGVDPNKLPETYVIFITENDIFEKNYPVYHIERRVTEINESFNDGSHILYVNGENNDLETEIGKLIHDFKETDPNKMYYPLIKQKTSFYKETEEGVAIMCKVMEEMREETILMRDKEMIAKKLKKNWTPEKIHEDDEYPMELIMEVQAELMSNE